MLAVVLVVLVSVLMITVVAVVAAFPCALVVTPVPLTVLATAAPAGKTNMTSCLAGGYHKRTSFDIIYCPVPVLLAIPP